MELAKGSKCSFEQEAGVLVSGDTSVYSKTNTQDARLVITHL